MSVSETWEQGKNPTVLSFQNHKLHSRCASIAIDPDDPHIKDCLSLTRSKRSVRLDCHPGPAEQVHMFSFSQSSHISKERSVKYGLLFKQCCLQFLNFPAKIWKTFPNFYFQREPLRKFKSCYNLARKFKLNCFFLVLLNFDKLWRENSNCEVFF